METRQYEFVTKTKMTTSNIIACPQCNLLYQAIIIKFIMTINYITYVVFEIVSGSKSFLTNFTLKRFPFVFGFNVTSQVGR